MAGDARTSTPTWPRGRPSIRPATRSPPARRRPAAYHSARQRHQRRAAPRRATPMPDLARVMLAMFELARQTGLRREDRQHLQDVTDLAVWTLLEYLRVGDQAQVGDACYRVERVTWSEVTPDSQERPHPHGAMALLRDEAVLGTVRPGLTRRQQADARTAMRQIRR